jgi:hypothetical protein
VPTDAGVIMARPTAMPLQATTRPMRGSHPAAAGRGDQHQGAEGGRMSAATMF